LVVLGPVLTRATFWFVVCSKHGMAGTLYACFPMNFILIT
jgi:hypothetical protein